MSSTVASPLKEIPDVSSTVKEFIFFNYLIISMWASFIELYANSIKYMCIKNKSLLSVYCSMSFLTFLIIIIIITDIYSFESVIYSLGWNYFRT